MDYRVINETPTTRFLGNCITCVRPLALECNTTTGFYTFAPCAECNTPIKLTRLVAVTTEEICDGRCMGAVGPNCSCGCGGANHGRAWGQQATTMQLQDALENHRAQVAKKEAAKQRRADAQRAREQKEFDDWKADTGEAKLIGWLLDYANVDGNEFLESLHERMALRREPLTDRQLAAARRCYAYALNRAAEKQQEAAEGKPVPLGAGVTIEGEVVSVKSQDGYGYGAVTYKMLVVGDGWKVWATVPKSLADVNATTSGNYFGLKGARVRFVANVELGRDQDPSFGVAKSPKRAERIAA